MKLNAQMLDIEVYQLPSSNYTLEKSMKFLPGIYLQENNKAATYIEKDNKYKW